MKKHSLLGASVYADEYTNELSNFFETRLYKRLSDKYTIKPYYKENRRRFLIARFASILFNIFSAFVGSYFVYSFLNGAIHVLANVFFTLLLLVIIEYIKRISFSDLAKYYFQFRKLSRSASVLCLALLVFSAYASYKGSNRFIHASTAPVHLINTDSINNALGANIAELKAQQADLKRVTYKGTTTRTAQRAINKVQAEILSIRESSKVELQEARRANAKASLIHGDNTEEQALLFSILALLIDAVIILCLVYSEYYDYRSLAEFSTMEGSVLPGIAEEEIKEEDNEEEELSTAPVHLCEQCNKEYDKTRSNKRFCSTECRQTAYEERTGKQLRVKGL